MLNERDDKYEGHEEGEYHFSDDQATYEMDSETSATHTAKPNLGGGIAGKLNQNRRMIIGVSVFFVLVFVVYKMLVPASQPVTDFSQNTPANPAPVMAAKMPQPPVAKPVPAQVAPAQTPEQPAQQPAAMPEPMQAQQPAAATPAATETVVQSTQPVSMPQQPTAAPTTQQPAVVIQQAIPAIQQQVRTIPERLAVLEDQAARIINAPQASNENQAAALQNKIQDLSNRVTNIETSLAQITQLLQSLSNKQQVATVQSAGVGPPPPAAIPRLIEPKIAYTVQAIIPGRAWLKSDAGETVTVAEGDVIKDLGRITKIDPYNGVVNIDTGNKILALSYGTSGD